jgi:hypothetical protein
MPLMLLVIALTTTLSPAATANPQNEISSSERIAWSVLRQAMQSQGDARHHDKLRSLRQLRDPLLIPLFRSLQKSSDPVMQVHGLLGEAEAEQRKHLSLFDLSAVEQSEARNELVMAGLQADLIDLQTKQTLLGWDTLDPGVRLVLATEIVASQPRAKLQPTVTSFLERTLQVGSLGQRSLAGLLLHEIGDQAGTQQLINLNHSQSAERDDIRSTLLDTADRYRLKQTTDWIRDLANHRDTPETLRLQALQVAMKFGDTRSLDLWAEYYDQTDDIVARTRLAFIALRAIDAIDPRIDERLRNEDDQLIQSIARVLQTWEDAEPAERFQSAIEKLLSYRHPWVSDWAAVQLRGSENAKTDGLRSVILAVSVLSLYQPGEEHGRARRLDAVLQASQYLASADPAKLVTAIENERRPATDEEAFRQVVLLGILRAPLDRSDDPIQLNFSDPSPEVAALQLLIYARQAVELELTTLRGLTGILEDQSLLTPALRVQAAWLLIRGSHDGAGPIVPPAMD